MTKSSITGKTYDRDNSSCIFVSNMVQSYKYLNALGSDYLLDILYSDTKNDCLVFVFKKCPEIQELYRRWCEHTL